MADRGAALLVVVVVLVVSALLAAWPRALDHIFTLELREQVERSPHFLRDVSAQATGVAIPATDTETAPTVDQLYDGFERSLDGIRDGAPTLVRTLLSDPEYQFIAGSRQVLDHVVAPLRGVYVDPVADPHYADRVRVVEGELPTGVTIADEADSTRLAELSEQEKPVGRDERQLESHRRPRTIDIALSVDTAERLGWPVGQMRQLGLEDDAVGPAEFARLTGIFEPVDPESAYWSHSLGLLQPNEEFDPNFGITAFASGFVAPTALSELAEPAWVLKFWYPVDTSALLATQAPDLLDQLRSFTAQAHRVTLVTGSLQMRSSTIDRLEETLNRNATAAALLTLVATGPFAVAMAVLALASRLVVERRRRAMALVGARGASRLQLRAHLSIQGALLGVPAAGLAIGVVARLIPGSGGVPGVVLPAVVGLAPAVLLPFVVKADTIRTERTDLGHRRRGRLRWALELLVIGAAAASVVVLNRRALTAGDPRGGIDVLLVATPLLVTLAVCVVVLRLYPIPLGAAARVLKRRGGVVAFVGMIRAVRDPAAGLGPVFALVVGLSIAVLSTVLWSTTQSGGVSSAINEVGADLRVDGPIISEEQVAAVGEIASVGAAASVTSQGRVEVRVGNRVDHAEVYITDTATLANVQAGLTGVAPITEGLDELRAGVVPVMLSAELGDPGDNGVVDIGTGFDVSVTGVAQRIAGLPADQPWVLVDRKAFAAAGFWYEKPPRILLIGSAGDAEVDQIQVAQLVGQETRMLTVTDALGRLQAGPVSAGLVASFLTAAAVVGGLSAVAVLLAQVIAAPTRGRLFSQLRTLGISPRQAQAIATWETAPVVVVALLCGIGSGVGIPWLVFAGLDLRPLTGALVQPPVTIDWALVSAAAGAFLVIVAIAMTTAVAFSRRLRLGTVLRVGEEL
jgi:putative ABC transport system permease protein